MPRLMSEIELSGQRVLIREDLNVPIKDGVVTSDVRIRAALPTLVQACDAGAATLVMSHLGRPEEGQFDPAFSLKPVAAKLSELLGREVAFFPDIEAAKALRPGEIGLLENVRFLPGEKKNDEQLARELASLCDVFVMDAFATAHRAQASTHGVAQYAPVACAGPLLAGELSALGRALQDPARDMLAIVGGAKVSTKLEVLESLADKADQIIVGGGIANTFMAAAGLPVGDSLYEPDLVPVAQRIAKKVEIPLPVDVVVASEIGDAVPGEIKPVDEVTDEDKILDIGPITARAWADKLTSAGTILWNGSGWCVRTRSVRRGHAPARRGNCRKRRVFHRRWRRHARGNRQIRRQIRCFLHLHGRRCIPRVRGRQRAACGRGARFARVTENVRT